ncbi:hypothetical protein, variant [Fonticula alba]|uniref:Peptidase M12B domain-containing protein n=1 Tax=Fonticula alba TaxID=691883 RepID=A0A058ZAQ5_FONAL|nr:hypothetical protein, variant [Fonticula alba]KCV71003.1 hypothetical protein, variant [Fonticula alba]|eukprot:XP_009494125.1 hypothetical protein, variant [Fonticula alba]
MAVSHGLPRALRALPLSLLLLALLSAMLGSVNAVAKFSSGSSPIVSAHSLRPVGISLSPKISTSARMRLAAADNLDGSEDADSNDELVLDLPHFFSNGSSISVSLRPVQHPAASQGYIEPMANFHDADQSVERVGSSISCLYRGHVVGQPQNRVVLSVCDGRVHGTIMHEGKIHQIMAANTFRALSAPHELELYNTLNTDAELAAASAAVAEAALDAHSYTEVPHLAFVLGAETAPEEVAGAATDDAPWCDGPLLPPGAPAKADAAPVAMASETGSSSEIVVTNYFIEVMAYVDYSLYAALTQEGMSKKQIIDYVRALFLQVEATYHESAFPEDMKVYVNPSRIEVITASTGNHFDIVQDSRTTLPAFSAWQAQAFPPGSSLRNFDIAVLLTHNRFLNNVAGLAYVGTACSLPESASCINTVNSFGSWAVVSHEIGHVLNASCVRSPPPPFPTPLPWHPALPRASRIICSHGNHVAAPSSRIAPAVWGHTVQPRR